MLIFLKVVLPLALGAATILDGAGRTVVVAGEAGEAAPRVQPFRSAMVGERNIADRAGFHALATPYAAVGVDTERPVAEQPLDKNAAQETAVGAGPTAGAALPRVGRRCPGCSFASRLSPAISSGARARPCPRP